MAKIARIDSQHLDSNESIFFADQLNHVMSTIYRKKYPALQAKDIIPTTSEAGPGSKTISYRVYDETGMSQWISNPADDLPSVGIHAREYHSPIKTHGDSYEYSILDIQAAAKAGVPLTAELGMTAKMVIEQKTDYVLFFGDDTQGIPGLLTNPNITRATVPDGATSSKTYWKGATVALSKTADEILKDMEDCVQSIPDNTNDVEMATELWISSTQYAVAANTPRSTNSDMTVLEFFQKNHPEITVRSVNRLKSIGTANAGAAGLGDSTNVMIALRADEDVLKGHVPVPFLQMAPQPRNLSQVVNCIESTGGTVVMRPLAISMYGGI